MSWLFSYIIHPLFIRLYVSGSDDYLVGASIYAKQRTRFGDDFFFVTSGIAFSLINMSLSMGFIRSEKLFYEEKKKMEKE